MMNEALKTDSVDTILLANSRVDVRCLNVSEPSDHWYRDRNDAVANVGTIINNLAFYGFAPNQRLIEIMASSDRDTLGEWWEKLDVVLWRVKGMDRNMDNHVVYKNFPNEVLHMDDCEYWIRQIFMYLGVPKENLAQPEVDRPELSEDISMIVLQPADRGPSELMHELQQQTTRWSDEQRDFYVILVNELVPKVISMTDFGFRENALLLMSDPSEFGLKHIPDLDIQDATDVARLASGISAGDVRLVEPVKFGSYPRSVRRQMVTLLEDSNNLEADASQRKVTFKKLFQRLHPGDFKAPRVQAVYDQLFNKKLKSYSAQVEHLMSEGSPEALRLLIQRPGELVRRFRVAADALGLDAVDALEAVTPKLSTRQLLKLFKYLETHHEKEYRTIAPNGLWHKLQVIENKVRPLNKYIATAAMSVLGDAIKARLEGAVPEGFDCRGNLGRIKLKSNDQALMPVGSGTVYKIPEGCNFLRTGSYWEYGSGSSSVWFDNTWNFFDGQWSPMGACAWNSAKDDDNAAIFSGDPVPGMDSEIRGCQLIDVYFDKLKAKGVRYAVWSVLCYSAKPFSSAKEVLATLQWGEKAEEGSLYEPSRAQFVLPIKDPSLNKFVAYVDLDTRELYLMDMTLPVAVDSGQSNCDSLSEKMPALVEYMNTQPSVADLFQFASKGSVPVVESDADKPVVGEKAFVFERVNPESDFGELDVEAILSMIPFEEYS
jgi:hypothetical protein